MSEIYAISPAEGFSAAVVRMDRREGMKLYSLPLACWALLGAPPDRAVEGLLVPPGSSEVVPAKELYRHTWDLYSEEWDIRPTMFVGYAAPQQSVEGHRTWALYLYEQWVAEQERDDALRDAGYDVTGALVSSPDGRRMDRDEALEEIDERLNEGGEYAGVH